MTTDFAAQRATMVESQVRVNDVTDYGVIDAMRLVPREQVLPADKTHLAYADVEPSYAPGRWLLKPRDIGKLLQALKAKPGETALCIAAPYAALTLEAMGLTVTRQDDPTAAVAGTYAIVVCEGAVTEVPAAWTAAIHAIHGRLGVVVRDGHVGRAKLYAPADGGVGRRDLFDCGPPLMAGFEPKAAFAF